MNNSQNSVQHIVGPWSIIAHNWHETSIYNAMGLRICKLDTEDWGVDEDTQDEFEQKQAVIARMIAVLPDLVEAARAVESHMVGRLPTQGYLCDNEASRTALGALLDVISKAATSR